ncbi:DUF4450 domain-containing protein [Pedobacter sp. SYSU D00535]|uniref:DUF4450 domain-containing protein n=1 Tax=Pedobacter sp. SYSU D00535 TaxID=2810308 RepID=UPI001A961545|nr:DUF4450 domain-containing protein [Pedobacter sp. SYSU D00535]
MTLICKTALQLSGVFGLALALVLNPGDSQAQQQRPWHGKERQIHYRPDGEDFVLANGKKRFNRALYGTNTGFRVETGDLPEFALYLPGMGGNLKFGIISGDQSRWIIDAKQIETRYRPGSMLYKIKDPILGNGTLHLTVLAQADAEGVIIKANFEGVKTGTELFWAFGGATGRKFSREGDIGADPESSFYLKPEYCRDNVYQLNKNAFQLSFGFGKALSEQERQLILQSPAKAKESGIAIEKQKSLAGVFPVASVLRLSDAEAQSSPLVLASAKAGAAPLLTGHLKQVQNKDLYFAIQNPASAKPLSYTQLASVFTKAEEARQKLASRVKVTTPDPFINTLGGALAVAADGIWEDPTFLHGAVAWRMRLNAWRGAYIADPLGWHDRAQRHFKSYANSQVISPETAPVVMDTALHLARHIEKMGTSVFSSGYISRNPNDNTRPHHYDMNLVFFDQMLTHFQWTGDERFIREMWPVIKRHLAWEKRNFDRNNDGLYDAYAAIWASDALQYSGGGVTHTSSYNYRSNKIAAQLAKIVGEDPRPYEQEAEKILKAINSVLWMPQLGWYAEYKDLLGHQLLHPAAGLWTVYHAIDSEVPDPFQAYQALRYVDTQIPHIPIQATGLPNKNYYTLSTTNWQPYDWSINNVALGEVLHTALAYWQGGRPEEAYKLWESILVESMYLSSSPGGFEQLSFYDAIRGELYRDFADPIGVAGRTLVEGLFGIKPNALNDTLTIQPGFPAAWNSASLNVPDIAFDFKRQGSKDSYTIRPSLPRAMNLKFLVAAKSDRVKSVTINGSKVSWKNKGGALEMPLLEVAAGKADSYRIEIEWDGQAIESAAPQEVIERAALKPQFARAKVQELFNPYQKGANEQLSFVGEGHKTVFYKLQQGDFEWWEPVNYQVLKPVEILAEQEQTGPVLTVSLKNRNNEIRGKLTVNAGKKAFTQELKLAPNESRQLEIPVRYVSSGTNVIRFEYADGAVEERITNWTVEPSEKTKFEQVDLRPAFNDAVTNIFKNKYLSPRPEGPTLQLPWQGIGNWCYPLTDANIDDSGLRKLASGRNVISLPNGVALSTPSAAGAKNIIFTSQWDNYPDAVRIPLKGKSSHAYMMLAGSTNPMQSRLDNGEIIIYYKDGSSERLALRNPETWWPIEQDYFTDGYAFTTGAPKPYRVYLKSGEISRTFKNFTSIKGYSNFAIDGGAATILDLPLNPDKELKELQLKTLANDVVIGLMSLTLQRK